MPSQKQATTRPASTPSSTRSPRPPRPPGESAFSAHFLERARRRQAAAADRPGEDPAHTPLTERARWLGPWEVEPVPAGHSQLHAATRRSEPAREGGGARLACQVRQEALLATATFPSLATPNRLTLNTEKSSGRRSPLGHPLNDGTRQIGHVSQSIAGAAAEFLTAFHTLRCLATDPEAAALFIEALDLETLAHLGRVIMQRLS